MTNLRGQDRTEPESARRARRFFRTGRLSLLIIVLGLAMTSSSRADGMTEASVEYRVKLACLYNFTKFVQWPSSSYRDAAAPLLICILGDDPFSPELEAELRTRIVDGHRVELRRLGPGDPIGACHIVFIPLTSKDQAAAIVKRMQGRATLTVSETQGFILAGGIINFAVAGNKLQLEVNPLAAERAGLRISSKLLNLATISRDD